MKVVEKEIEKILDAYKTGRISVGDAMEKMRLFVYESIDYATIDHHRELRIGIPEVIYGEGKTGEQILSIAQKIYEKSGKVLITRVAEEKGLLIEREIDGARYRKEGLVVTIGQGVEVKGDAGPLLVVSAGTSDMAVAEEAALTAEFFGNRVDRMYDVGVAGIHRLFFNKSIIDRAGIIIVVAGMEGALASVVGGISGKPVIAVPTSIGYGASFGGISALLGMLNSCAPGVVVVNIDNGFGAAYFATLLNRIIGERDNETEAKS